RVVLPAELGGASEAARAGDEARSGHSSPDAEVPSRRRVAGGQPLPGASPFSAARAPDERSCSMTVALAPLLDAVFGGVCRLASRPLAAPPVLIGALLVVFMMLGFLGADPGPAQLGSGG